MLRIHIICEGQTEETFVNNVLAPAFSARHITLLPSLLGKPGHKGGNLKWERLFNDVRNRLTGDRQAYCSTFFDYYALPTDFPGRATAAGRRTAAEKAAEVESHLDMAFRERLGDDVIRRFIPYVQMYEFEGLLFSDTEAFARSIDRPQLIPELSAVRAHFPTPEDINDSSRTAPSKRIRKLIQDYEKPLMGTIAALDISLTRMREECHLFNAWIERLERLGGDDNQITFLRQNTVE
jgi:hypothetical protein